MLILVCGSRDWTSQKVIEDKLLRFDPRCDIIMHGCCRGADSIAGQIALSLGFSIFPFPADWATYGKRAGMIRNIQMLDQKPGLVIAFHDNLVESKGTKHTVNEAKRRGIKVEVVSSIG